ncbi:MAG: hypothetical protein OEY94_08680 [Alphaproteobacteria bacterium]|nr:hypothetical protein [Alphaproteobacteria bacterium]
MEQTDTNNMKKSALILRQLSPFRIGSFERTLLSKNFDLRYIDTYKEDLSAIDPLQHDVVITLGCTLGVNDSNKFPFINDIIRFLEKRITKDKPTLGICFGAQIMAKILGANVYKGQNGFEKGWSPLIITEEGKKSAIKHFNPEITSMFHSHNDTFDLPKNATLLASSKKYPHQAYKYGENIIAMQCHPEVTLNMIEEWLIMFVDQISADLDLDINIIREETKKNISSLQTQSIKFLEDWLKDIKVI